MILVGVSILLTMPYGIYNKLENGTYVISSSGSGGHFLTGHNEDIYTQVVNPPPIDTEEGRRLKDMNNFNVFHRLETQLQGLSHSQKQSLYLNAGLEWVKANPSKSIELAAINLRNFLQPGFHKGNQPPKKWLVSFLIALPIFILAYFEIARSVGNNWRGHTTIVCLFLTMVAFSVIFYSQNRFRVITIEPWYLMYACSGFLYLYDRLIKKQGNVASR